MRGDFHIGQKVKLSSGGPLMTIDHLEDGVVGCVWFEDTKLNAGNFRPGTLSRPAEDEADEESEGTDNFG